MEEMLCQNESLFCSLYLSSGLALIQHSFPKSAVRKILKYCEVGTIFSAAWLWEAFTFLDWSKLAVRVTGLPRSPEPLEKS